MKTQKIADKNFRISEEISVQDQFFEKKLNNSKFVKKDKLEDDLKSHLLDNRHKSSANIMTSKPYSR